MSTFIRAHSCEHGMLDRTAERLELQRVRHPSSCRCRGDRVCVAAINAVPTRVEAHVRRLVIATLGIAAAAAYSFGLYQLFGYEPPIEFEVTTTSDMSPAAGVFCLNGCWEYPPNEGFVRPICHPCRGREPNFF